MFVSASLLLDYRAERLGGSVRPLTAVRCGLSEIGWKVEGDLGRGRAVAGDGDAGRWGARCRVLSVVALVLGWGEVAEGGVPAPGVVPGLDVLEHGGPAPRRGSATMRR